MSSLTNTRPKVLFVDDSLSMRKAAEQYLGERYAVVTACDGEEALNALAVHDDVQALISDLTMPKCDGRELLRALRCSNNDYLINLPVIIVTGTQTQGLASKLTKAGAHGVMTKPYKPEALVRRTQQLLDFSARAMPARIARPEPIQRSTDRLLASISGGFGDDAITADPKDSELDATEASVDSMNGETSSLNEPDAALPMEDARAEATELECIEDAAPLLSGMEASAEGLQRRLRQAVALHVRHDLPMVVVKLEVLNYPDICANASNAAQLQTFIQQCLCNALREEDSAGPYRDEIFLIVLPMTTESGGVVVLNRLQEVFEEQSFRPDTALKIRATLCQSELAQLDLESLDAVGRRFAETDQAFEEVMITTPVSAEAA